MNKEKNISAFFYFRFVYILKKLKQKKQKKNRNHMRPKWKDKAVACYYLQVVLQSFAVVAAHFGVVQRCLQQHSFHAIKQHPSAQHFNQFMESFFHPGIFNFLQMTTSNDKTKFIFNPTNGFLLPFTYYHPLNIVYIPHKLYLCLLMYYMAIIFVWYCLFYSSFP